MCADHIHSGNIMVDKRVCKLSDIEDAFLSLPSFYRTSLAEFRKIQTKEDAVVYAFGRILYEMGCGCMMKLGAMEMVSSTCHSEVRTLLESLLSESALKSGLPSIDDLISKPLFPELQPPTDKPQLKVSSKLKEALKQVQEAEEADMHERAKKVPRQTFTHSYICKQCIDAQRTFGYLCLSGPFCQKSRERKASSAVTGRENKTNKAAVEGRQREIKK
jgi:hypothetical protein